MHTVGQASCRVVSTKGVGESLTRMVGFSRRRDVFSAKWVRDEDKVQRSRVLTELTPSSSNHVIQCDQSFNLFLRRRIELLRLSNKKFNDTTLIYKSNNTTKKQTNNLERETVADIFLGHDEAHRLPEEQPDANADRHREDVHPNDHPVPIRRDPAIVRQPALHKRASAAAGARSSADTHGDQKADGGDHRPERRAPGQARPAVRQERRRECADGGLEDRVPRVRADHRVRGIRRARDERHDREVLPAVHARRGLVAVQRERDGEQRHEDELRPPGEDLLVPRLRGRAEAAEHLVREGRALGECEA